MYLKDKKKEQHYKKNNMKKLPVYKIEVSESDELGVNYIAMVDTPAIERNWMAFSETKKYEFKSDEDKKIISGPMIVSNLPIYRRDAQGEYFVVFDTETTMEIVQRFFRRGFTANVNEMHDETKIVDNVFMFESFIINKERGILTPTGHTELPDGSWFGSFKVNNDEVWKKIKSGEFMGFSVEGMFGQRFIGDKDEAVIKEIQEVIQLAEKIN
jgi:hypothetical protein